MNDQEILEDSIFRVGKVISVNGRAVKIKVDKTKNTSHLLYKGELLKNISVGGYVKIVKGFTKIIGKVEGEYINEDRDYSKKEYSNDREKVDRILNVSLLGFFNNGEFERGIKELPLIDNECFLLENKEFTSVHDFIKNGDEPITIGTLTLEKGQKINIGVNSLFASHIGVFGNTGSGKSYTLAKIYRELFLKFLDQKKFMRNAHFFLLDFNGEYIGKNAIIENENKKSYELSTRKNQEKDQLPISEDSINDPAFWNVFLTATEKTQAPFIKRTLIKGDIEGANVLNLVEDIVTNEDRKLEKGIIFNFLEEIKYFLIDEIDIRKLRLNLKYHSKDNTYYLIENNGTKCYANANATRVLNQIKILLKEENYDFALKTDLSKLDKIHLKLIFHYFNEICRGFSNQEHLAPLIKRLDKRIYDLAKIVTVKEKQSQDFLTIVSLKDVNADMTKILPLLICKELYDKKKKENKKESYLNIIIDEAHNILSYSSERENDTWKDYRLETFEEIIKEGRKFGVFLTIASQRPSDISATIISQLHNYFLHRLINNNDILAIERTIAYLDKISVESLSILPTGTCILAGIMAQVPVIIDIDPILPSEYEPNNKTITLIENWQDENIKKNLDPKNDDKEVTINDLPF